MTHVSGMPAGWLIPNFDGDDEEILGRLRRGDCPSCVKDDIVRHDASVCLAHCFFNEPTDSLQANAGIFRSGAEGGSLYGPINSV